MQDNGILAVIIPTKECGLTIEEIAIKDVPTGKKYHIVEDTEIPSDKTFRDAWIWE